MATKTGFSWWRRQFGTAGRSPAHVLTLLAIVLLAAVAVYWLTGTPLARHAEKLKLSVPGLAAPFDVSPQLQWGFMHWPPTASGNAQRGVALQRELYQEFVAAEFARHTCLAAIRRHLRDIFSPILANITGGIALVLVPTHGNFGDTLLWHGEMLLLEQLYKAPRLVCSEQNKFACGTAQQTVELVGNNGLYLFHAGGNWGSTWRWAHGQRLEYIAGIQEELGRRGWQGTIVQLPQSVYYDNATHVAADVVTLGRVVEHLNTTFKLFVRQHASVKEAAAAFGSVTNLEVLLSPDMAFAVPPVLLVQEPSVDVLLLMRTDHEASHGLDLGAMQRLADQVFGGTGHSYKIDDWELFLGDVKASADHHSNFTYPGEFEAGYPAFFASTRWQRMMRQVAVGKVVVSDRLHATITALLIGRHHIVLDNSYGKVTGTREVAFAASPACTAHNLHASVASSFEDALHQAVSLLNKPFWHN